MTKIDPYPPEKEQTDWYETYDNVLGLASWLNGECYFNSTGDMLYYFEKPWKWTREFNLWRLWQEHCGIRNDGAEQVVDAVADSRITAKQLQAEWEEHDDRTQD